MGSIEFKDEVKAIWLPSSKDNEEKGVFNKDTVFVASGWGLLFFGGNTLDTSEVLQSVSLPWVSEQDCQKAHNDSIITKDYICAGDVHNGGNNVCLGDSGGPLAWLDRKTGEVKLIGVTSWGRNATCLGPRNPPVFAEVSKVLDWIREVTDDCNDKTCDAE